MGTEMQFTTDGVVHRTLDIIPFDGFMDGGEVARAMGIGENVSTARLKLLFDNGMVFRQKSGGRFQYTRSRNLELPLVEKPAEKPEVKVMDEQLNSSRHIVAELLKNSIGDTVDVQYICEETGVSEDEIRPMMHDLKHSEYVQVDEDGNYEVLEAINGYKPNKNRRAVRSQAPAPAAPVMSITDSLTQLVQEHGDYKAALCLIQETLLSVLGDEPCQKK